jgi:hypothetical protein
MLEQFASEAELERAEDRRLNLEDVLGTKHSTRCGPQSSDDEHTGRMVLGRGSQLGKSLITAPLCGAFAHATFGVPPFKAQNMSLTSAATSEELENGRAGLASGTKLAAMIHMHPSRAAGRI